MQSFSDNRYLKIRVPIDSVSYTLGDLTPGATYSLHLFTVLDAKKSVAYTSKNFTTKPNTLRNFYVWFRTETTLEMIWYPPTGIYTHYKVNIDPPDAVESVLYVEKKDRPARAAFKGLVPEYLYTCV
ncbi:tyrosine-protein phosphatase 10D-like [Anoplolepis gracilipes]|uniref:tyrosine-protein phosphatase 10D-like n=1 Tax=Anoplolepis gracilipes TaxID=354296 RepID=UPI003B9EB2FF